MTTFDQPTETTGGTATTPAVPPATPDTIDLPDQAAAWIQAIRHADTQIAQAEDLKKIARGHLEQLLGEHQHGRIDGQLVVNWTFVRSRRLDQRKLKEQDPDLVEACTVDAVSRRFTLAGDQ